MPLTLQVNAATVPVNLECVISNTNLQSLAALLTVTIGTEVSFVNIGSITPSPDNRIWPWKRSNADGSPDRDYIYWNGAWVSRHPLEPGFGMPWWGNELDIPTLGGGEASPIPPTAIAGPFWEVMPGSPGRFPVVPGTFAGGAVVAVNGVGGEDLHTLIDTELPQGLGLGAEAREVFGQNRLGSGLNTLAFTTDTATQPHAVMDVPLNGGQPHNNLPPYIGTWLLRRTARIFYRI